jgi:hypothetical protein
VAPAPAGATYGDHSRADIRRNERYPNRSTATAPVKSTTPQPEPWTKHLAVVAEQTLYIKSR